MFNKTGKTEVDLIKVPSVIFSSDSIMKMRVYTEQVDDEVGWLGTVQKIGINYYVQDVFLFEQEVHSTTTEITPEGLSTFAEELLATEGGVDKWNSMKLWGHSHVNMAVFASGQDDKQIKELKKNTDFFLRVIANKKGDIKVDIYDNEITVQNADFTIALDGEMEELNNLMIQIKNQIEMIEQQKLEECEKEVIEEIKLKVKEKTYLTKSSVTTIGNSYHKDDYSYGIRHGYDDDYPYGSSYLNDVKKNEDDKNNITYQEVADFFSEEELIGLSTVVNIDEFEDLLNYAGYKENFFNSTEIKTIMRYADDYVSGKVMK